MRTTRQPMHETAGPVRGRTAPPAAAGEVLPPAGTELVDWRAESREPRAESREPRASLYAHAYAHAGAVPCPG